MCIRDSSVPSPSIVVICLPVASLTGTLQERTAMPSIWTVQAPHCAMPQPYLVPVRPIFSRIAQSSGVSGSTSTSNALPLIVRFAIAFPLLGLVPALESDAGPKTAPVQIQILHIWRGIIDVRRGTSRFPGRGLPGVFGVSLQALSLIHISEPTRPY